MELKDFVSETLVQIIEGVKDAKKNIGDSNAEISPNYSNMGPTHSAASGLCTSRKGHMIRNVEFDIALTELDGTKTKGGIGVFFGPVTLGSTGQSASENQSVNRIKFSVPITLPTDPKESR